MTDTMIRGTNLSPDVATAVLRQAYIDRQQQSGTLDPSVIDDIRMGKQDQSIGFDDAAYALTNAEVVWGKAQQDLGSFGGLGKQEQSLGERHRTEA